MERHDATNPAKPATLRLGAPLYANTYRIHPDPDGAQVVITLGHDRGATIVWHTEIVAPIADANSLGGMLMAAARKRRRK